MVEYRCSDVVRCSGWEGMLMDYSGEKGQTTFQNANPLLDNYHRLLIYITNVNLLELPSFRFSYPLSISCIVNMSNFEL